jgi:hypothetical protein
MAADPSTHSVVVVNWPIPPGGTRTSVAQIETWDGKDWSPAPQEGPWRAPLQFDALLFDPVLGRLVAFADDQLSRVLRQLWVWTGTTLLQLDPRTPT